EIAAVLDPDPAGRPAGHRPRALRGGVGRRRRRLAPLPLHHLAVDQHALRHLHPAFDDLHGRRLQQRLPADRRRPGRSHPRAGDARHPLSAARPDRTRHGLDRVRPAADPAAGVFHDAAAVAMTRAKLMRGVSAEAALLLVGIPVLLWTLIPIYHMFLFAISPKDAAFSGQLWPANPTIRNFEIVLGQKHHFLYHFWRQMFNSLAISCATAVLTLLIASAAAFTISRLRMKGGR